MTKKKLKEKINNLEKELKQFKGNDEEKTEELIRKGFYNAAYFSAKNVGNIPMKMVYYEIINSRDSSYKFIQEQIEKEMKENLK